MQGRLPNPSALWLRRALVILAGVALVLLGGGRALAADAPGERATDKRWVQVTPSAVLPVRIGERWGVLRPDGSTLLSPVYSSVTLHDVASARLNTAPVALGANFKVSWGGVDRAFAGVSPPLVPPAVFIVAVQPPADRELPSQSIVFTVDGRRLFEYPGWKGTWIASTELLDRSGLPRRPFDPWLPDPVAGDGPEARVHLVPGAAYAGVEVMPVPAPKAVSATATAVAAPAAERPARPAMLPAYEEVDRGTLLQWQEQVGRERKIPDLTSYGCGILPTDDGSAPYLYLLAKRGRPFLLAHAAAKKMKQIARDPYVSQSPPNPNHSQPVYLVGSEQKQVRLASSARYFAIAVDQHVALYSDACELLAEADLPPFDTMRFSRDGQCLYITTSHADPRYLEGQLLFPDGTLHDSRVRIPAPNKRQDTPNMDDLAGPAFVAQTDTGVGLLRPDLKRWVVEPTAKAIYRTADGQFFRVLGADQKVRIVNERGALELLSERSCADYLPLGAVGPAALVIHFERLGDFTPTLQIGDAEPVRDSWTTGRIMAYTARYLAFEVNRSSYDALAFAYRIYDRVRGEWLSIEPHVLCRVSPDILYVEDFGDQPAAYLMPDGSRIIGRRPAPNP